MPSTFVQEIHGTAGQADIQAQYVALGRFIRCEARRLCLRCL